MNSQDRLQKFLDPGRTDRKIKARKAFEAQRARNKQRRIDAELEDEMERNLPEEPPEPRPKSQFDQLAELLGMSEQS